MEIAITAAIIMISLVFLQFNHYSFIERQKELDKTLFGSEEIAEMRKEFDDYKKRVDTLTLKAGFKL